MSDKKTQKRWLSLPRAADYLDESPTGLRKKLDRAASVDELGVIHATLPGLRARKLGKLWKVLLDEGWLS